jgi:hypothetical protein
MELCEFVRQFMHWQNPIILIDVISPTKLAYRFNERQTFPAGELSEIEALGRVPVVCG